jgi:hypothetical protein
LRSINEGRLEAIPAADDIHQRNRDGIRDVRAIPREQIVEAVARGDCDVKGVFIRFRGNVGTGNQRRRQTERFLRYLRQFETT